MDNFMPMLPKSFLFVTTIIELVLIVCLVIFLLLIIKNHRGKVAAERKLAEANLREQHIINMEARTEERNQFFSNISHDMRTPLNGILGYANLALEDGVSEHERKRYLEKIQASGKLLLALINDTLTLSRLDSGKLELDPQPIKTDAILEPVLQSVDILAQEKQVSFFFDRSGYQPSAVVADGLNVQKILLNLLTNAIKYNCTGGHVRLTVNNENVLGDCMDFSIMVEDDGIGISQESLKKVFEPFYQEKRPGYETLGTGLGLSIVKQLTELMGGSVEVKSELDKGTCMTVRLRFARANDNGTVAHPSDDSPQIPLRGKRILLCEDNTVNREIAVALLQKKELIVDTAENGKAGMERFRASAEYQYDAILMDLHMPVMDGYAATAAIRSMARPDARTVPIIAMTADAFDEDIHKCLSAGMNAHIPKPFDSETLFTTLSSVMKERQS